MSLNDGQYYIRLVPRGLQPPFDGGIFMSFNDESVGEVVKAARFERAKSWNVKQVPGKRNKFFIKAKAQEPLTSVELVNGISVLNLGLDLQNGIPLPGEKIILSNSPREWVFMPTEVDNVYVVRAEAALVEADFCIGEGEYDDLKIKTYPVLPEFMEMRPRWEFIALERKQAPPSSFQR